MKQLSWYKGMEYSKVVLIVMAGKPEQKNSTSKEGDQTRHGCRGQASLTSLIQPQVSSTTTFPFLQANPVDMPQTNFFFIIAYGYVCDS